MIIEDSNTNVGYDEPGTVGYDTDYNTDYNTNYNTTYDEPGTNYGYSYGGDEPGPGTATIIFG